MEAKKINQESIDEQIKLSLRTLDYKYHPLKFRGEIKSLKIVLVPIEDIYYRPRNHRIQCAMKECIAKTNGRLTEEILSADIRRKEVQEMVEKALCFALGEDSAQLEDKLVKEHQTTPLILSLGNILVNGNSRYFIMKKLYELAPVKYAHFKEIRCVYLPEDATESEIDEFEIQEQLEPDVTVNYLWYETANWMMEYKRSSHKANEEVAKKFRLPKLDAVKMMHALEEGLLYLNHIGKPHQYRLIEHERSALEALYDMKKKLGKEPAKQKLAEHLCYGYLILPIEERPERLFLYFRRIGNFLEKIEETLLEIGPVADALLEFPSKIDEEKDEIDALFGDEGDLSNAEKILTTLKNLEPQKQGQVRVMIDKVIDIEKIKAKDKENKLIPEMEMRQAIDHIQNSFAHYSNEHAQRVAAYIDQALKLLTEYSKKVRK
ncbi:hypothetical protein [Bacillus sp. S14(2024)]|uniref:hypothetical protein n=1 Tax=Bacillus sp. S14(2024) TaxID=3162884 RepID=UPI003D23F9B0